jgi:hypothetical protein
MLDTSVVCVARRSFRYDLDLELDKGQIFNPRNHRNDDKLLRLGYFEVAHGRPEIHECNRCGAKFKDYGSLNTHGNLRHRDLEDIDVCRKVDNDYKILQESEPLYLDKAAGADRRPIEVSGKRKRGRPRKRQ